jgi:ATP-binding cassette subfamily B protein
MIGLVGHSGSGKSTLVNLICRFYDVTEGASHRRRGHPPVPVADYRRNIGLVLQEPFLFFGTIAENIAYGKPDATRDEIVAAARAAHAHEFILRLPQGYDSLVGERGQGLSGGERQRISIARALLIDPRILILDEATPRSTPRPRRNPEGAGQPGAGRTTIAIAHRLSTLRKADRLVVMDRAEGGGGHARELMARRAPTGGCTRRRRGRKRPSASACWWSRRPRRRRPMWRGRAGHEHQPAGPAARRLRPPGADRCRGSPARRRGGRARLSHRGAGRGISLLDADGHELAWIERMDDCPAPQRELIEQALRQREFMPVLKRLKSVSSFATPSTWEVDTAGPRASRSRARKTSAAWAPTCSLSTTARRAVPDPRSGRHGSCQPQAARPLPVMASMRRCHPDRGLASRDGHGLPRDLRPAFDDT